MKLIEFSDRHAASAAAAGMIAEALEKSLGKDSTATMAIAGGSTPVECYELLSRQPLPWRRVIVTLTDERDVPPDHELSNERMVRGALLQDAAAGAEFVPLFMDSSKSDHPPFAVVLLGMGEDGHFAGIFPDAANLDDLLRPDGGPGTAVVSTCASPVRRHTRSLYSLLNTSCLLMMAFGERKRTLLLDPSDKLPVHALRHHAGDALTVYWAP